MATRDGLVRFDGVHFTVFTRSTSPGITSNQLTALYEDRDGALWIGTLDAGLIRYLHGEFTAYGIGQSTGGWVQGISGDESGRVWILIHGKVMQWVNGELIAEKNDDLQKENGISRELVQRQGNGGFWIPEPDDLQIFADGHVRTLPWPGALSAREVFNVAQDQQGALWAASGSSAVRIDGGQGSPAYGRDICSPHSWISAFVNGPRSKFVCVDRRGNLAFIDLQSGEQSTIANAPQELSHEILYPLFYEDREGNLWIGTAGRGLYRASKTFITSYSQPQGLKSPTVYPIYQDHGGAIWIATWPFVLHRLQDGSVRSFAQRDGLPPFIQSLFEDAQGRLWIGAYDGDQRDGLRVLEQGHIRVPPEPLRNLGVALTTYQDKAGTLWFGTETTVVRYKEGFATTLTVKDGMPLGGARVITEDHAGDLWFGSNGGGLARLSGGKFHVLTTADGLPGNNIRSLYEDPQQALWIGTYDGGLGRLKAGKLTRFTTHEGLFDDGVFQILEDARGFLWMSCNRGIYRVAKEQLNAFAEGKRNSIVSTAYGKSDGMLETECNGGSPPGIKAADGTLWFPTQNGVAIVHPDAVIANPRPPPVLVESFLVGQAAIALDEQARVGVGQENFEIHYTSVTFTSPEQLKFRYKLEGLDRDWVDAGTRRTAYYSHVPPGKYVFKAIAANRDGVWSAESEGLRVTVIPAFYQTWWFATIAWAAVLGIAALTWRYRVAQLKRAHTAQQDVSRQLIILQESERKRIAAELHDSLGQRLVIIKNLALISLKESNSTSSREVEEISSEASQALGEVKEISYNLRPYQLDRIGLTKAIEGLIRKVSGASTISFRADIDDIDDVFPKEKEINFYRIVQESLNNIIKHSQATQASITVDRDTENILLTISDNGKGFTPSAAPGTTGGFGLVGISERAQLLNGRSKIATAPGHGTTLSVEIGLRRHAR